MAQELTYKWVQDRLRDLHAGKLSAKDKARLESIALQDPFVADALEGYKAHPDAMHDAYLAALAEKIRHAPRERRRWLIPNLTVTAIAASVMLIIATYAVITRMAPTSEESLTVILNTDSLDLQDSLPAGTVVWSESDKAMAEDLLDEPVTETTNPGMASNSSFPSSRSKTIPPPIVEGDDLVLAEIKSQPSSLEEKEGRNEIAGNIANPSDTRATEIMSAAEIKSKTSPLERGREDELDADTEKPKPSEVDNNKEDIALYANQMNPDLMARRVTGRVINPSGTPLHGVDIRVANTNLGATSGDEGRFELFLPLPQNDIQVYLPGYAQATVQLEQGQMDKDIVLEPALEDAIVSYQKLDTKDPQRDDAIKPATAGAPRSQVSSDIWTGYIKTSSRIPLRENYYMPGKEVTVQFRIRSNGKPDDLRLLRSSGEKRYDDEALRLIREWDKWQCEVKDCLKEYTLYFE